MSNLGPEMNGCIKAITSNGTSSYTCEKCDNGYWFDSSPEAGEPYCIEEKNDGSYDSTTANCLV